MTTNERELLRLIAFMIFSNFVDNALERLHSKGFPTEEREQEYDKEVGRVVERLDRMERLMATEGSRRSIKPKRRRIVIRRKRRGRR